MTTTAFRAAKARCHICKCTVKREDTETIRRGDLWLTVCRSHLDMPYSALDAYELSLVPVEHP